METSRSYKDLEIYHEDLRHLFARHQLAVMHREFGEALALLDAYQDALSRHLTDEEVWLLPLLRRARAEPGRTGEAFRSDHRRLQVLLSGIRRATIELRDHPATVKQIALIEREHRYKDLFEAHSEREHNLLFPLLDQLSAGEERSRVLSHCRIRPNLLPPGSPS